MHANRQILFLAGLLSVFSMPGLAASSVVVSGDNTGVVLNLPGSGRDGPGRIDPVGLIRCDDPASASLSPGQYCLTPEGGLVLYAGQSDGKTLGILPNDLGSFVFATGAQASVDQACLDNYADATAAQADVSGEDNAVCLSMLAMAAPAHAACQKVGVHYAPALGYGWRLPSYQEWVDISAGATNVYLDRGLTRLYWSSSESTATQSWVFNPLAASGAATGKDQPVPVRCVRGF